MFQHQIDDSLALWLVILAIALIIKIILLPMSFDVKIRK